VQEYRVIEGNILISLLYCQ